MLHAKARTTAGAVQLAATLQVAPGECLALAGPSGAGKTTLLRIIAGLTRPREGRVTCGGQTWLDTAAGIDLPPEARPCGYVFQDYALFPHLSAWQNVAYPMAHLCRRDRRPRALELLGQFGIAKLADRHPAELSGGERQRVAVARALARRPHALLLDEPLSALDPRLRAAAGRELVAVLQQAGLPAVLVTHDFTEAALLGTRIAVLDDGRVVQQGTASELAASPTSAFIADFTGAVVLTGSAAPGPGGLTEVTLDGGGTLLSTDPASGAVAACLYPWELTLAAAGTEPSGSAQNHLPARVLSVTTVGNRVRVGLAAPQALTAEITADSAIALHLAPGDDVVVAFKAAGTRLLAR